jgi:hypothetical protein
MTELASSLYDTPMQMLRDRSLKRLYKKTKRGFRGFPMATIAFYGPDGSRATKVAVGIHVGQDEEPAELRRWFFESEDIRNDPAVFAEILAYIEQYGAKSVTMVDSIIGCPHEEGVDYEGETCPRCPYWAGRDRWTGKLVRQRC